MRSPPAAKHPLGILVEQRGLGWNFPVGNEDIIYFVYTFYNVTASDPAAYAGIRPGMREIAAAQGATFQQQNEPTFGVSLPDGGYTHRQPLRRLRRPTWTWPRPAATTPRSTCRSRWATPTSTTFTPADGWTFDPAIFSPPFFSGSGFVGVKYLKSPVVDGEEVGLTLFSNTINGGAFNDAQNVTQLYRYLSNNISTAAGDARLQHRRPAG